MNVLKEHSDSYLRLDYVEAIQREEAVAII